MKINFLSLFTGTTIGLAVVFTVFTVVEHSQKLKTLDHKIERCIDSTSLSNKQGKETDNKTTTFKEDSDFFVEVYYKYTLDTSTTSEYVTLTPNVIGHAVKLAPGVYSIKEEVLGVRTADRGDLGMIVKGKWCTVTKIEKHDGYVLLYTDYRFLI